MNVLGLFSPRLSQALPFLFVLGSLPAFAEEDKLQVVPEKWFTDGSEFLNTTFADPSGIPRASSVGLFNERIADTDSEYILTSDFAQNDSQAIYVFFMSGRVLKYDFIDRATDWDIRLSDSARNAKVSADGNTIAIATNSSIQLHSTVDGSLIARLENICQGACLSLQFSQDGRFIISGDSHGFAHIIEVRQPTHAWHRKMHEWPLRKLLFIESGTHRFLVTSDLSEIILFDLDTEEVRRHIGGQRQLGPYYDFWVNAFEHVSGSNFFIVGGYSDAIVIDAATGLTVDVFTGPVQPLLRAYASTDLQKIIGLSKDHIIYVWDVNSAGPAKRLWMETSRLSQFIDMAVSPDGRYTAIAALEPQISFPPKIFNRVRIYALP